MSRLADTLAAITPPDPAVAVATARILDHKTKPPGSLGRLEELACRLAAARGTPRPAAPVKAIVVCGADHGVAEDGVSAYPREVTAQMMLNFARGGAGINALARHAEARVIVVDVGVAAELPPLPELRSRRVAAGTGNFTRGPAMSDAQARAAIDIGIEIAQELAADGVTLLGLGEMGIGNTTSASALTAALTGASPELVTGRGTGVDDDGLARKLGAIRRALALHAPIDGALDALAKLGGLEIAALVGVALGGAAARIPVLVDGFIATAAALVAAQLAPACRGYLIASHRSVERGHAALLEALDQRPLLDLDLRLGEGTGAALAMHLCDAAIRVLAEMATFEEAAVSR